MEDGVFKIKMKLIAGLIAVLLFGLGVREARAYELPVSAISGFEKVMDRGNDPKTYNYAPSIMLDDGGVYRMWWCGNFEPTTKPENDKILYATSTNGTDWSTPIKVLDSQRRPNQGRCACDPTVVRSESGEYYVFYTTDHPEHMNGMWGNQVFLAWTNGSGDPARISYAFEGKPVISLPASFDPDSKLYGYGQSSVLWKDNGFQMFYSDMSVAGRGWITSSFSSDGGRSFGVVKPDLGAGAMAMDIKWMPNRQIYVAVAETPQWHIMMFLFDKNFNLLQKITFPVAENSIDNGRRSNHNPGLLGDRYGNVVDEERPTIYFASSGEVDELPSPSGPYNWKLYRAKIDLSSVLPVPGSCGNFTVTPKCVNTGGSYTVSVTATNVAKVLFPTWDAANGQDDIVWYDSTRNGNTWLATIRQSAHSHGEITTHAYRYDSTGVPTACGGGTIVTCTTVTPTKKPTATPTKKLVLGDADGNGKVNVADFAVWKTEYLTKSGTRSDFDKNGKVTIADFAIWKKEFLGGI